MMSDKKNDPNEKGRYWAGLIYPGDSAPDNWQELMQRPANPRVPSARSGHR